MPRKRPLEFLTEPPAGMWYEHDARAGNQYRARWRNVEGAKESKSFPSPDDRAAFAATWADQRANFGKAVEFVEPHTVAIWREFAQITANADPLIVAREWLHLKGRNEVLPLADAWTAFNSDQEQRKLSGDTHSHRRLHGKRLVKFFSGRTLGSITSEDLDRWLASLDFSPKAKSHHLKNARHFFGWHKDRQRIAHNPANAVTVPDATTLDGDGNPVHHEVNILTVDECRLLFEKNAGRAVVGRLAFEAFGGLRYTSAARLVKADVNFAGKGVTLPGYKHKSGRRHYVDGWPANLWQWVESAPAACWEMNPRQYADEKRDAFVRAGVTFTHNCLRHSFVTYHLAGFKEAKLTAYLTTKTSMQSLQNDYRGRATEAAGRAWFEIRPAAK